jgi:hypothetical protein
VSQAHAESRADTRAESRAETCAEPGETVRSWAPAVSSAGCRCRALVDADAGADRRADRRNESTMGACATRRARIDRRRHARSTRSVLQLQRMHAGGDPAVTRRGTQGRLTPFARPSCGFARAPGTLPRVTQRRLFGNSPVVFANAARGTQARGVRRGGALGRDGRGVGRRRALDGPITVNAIDLSRAHPAKRGAGASRRASRRQPKGRASAG